jgi:hypothetical protein
MNPEPLWSDVIDAPTAALMAGRTLAPFRGRRLAVVAGTTAARSRCQT